VESSVSVINLIWCLNGLLKAGAVRDVKSAAYGVGIVRFYSSKPKSKNINYFYYSCLFIQLIGVVLNNKSAVEVFNMSQGNKPFDRLFRFSMGIKLIAMQFLQSNLESLVRDVLDLDTLKQISNESVNLKLNDSVSDMVYQCHYKDKSIAAAKIIILIEHQSTPDRFMPLRIYHYLFGLMLNEVKARKKNRNKPLPACWAMVFYHGKQQGYPYSLDLASCFDDPKGIMQQFWNNPVQLVNVNKISDEQLLARELDGILALT